MISKMDKYVYGSKNKDNIQLYRHIRMSDNRVFYIGIGRPGRSISKTKRNLFWKNTVAKHGYYIDILKYDLTWSEATELERILISYYGRVDNNTGVLTNMTDGGDGSIGAIVSDDTRKKMSLANSGKTYSRIYVKKEKKPISEEDKIIRKEKASRNRSIAAKKRGISKDTQIKMLANRKFIVTKETREKMRAKRLGVSKPQKIFLNIETGVYHFGHKDVYNSYNFSFTEDALRARINREQIPFIKKL